MNTWYSRRGKRACDLVAACVLMAALSPLMLVVAVLVRLSIGTPVLFRQPRPGRGGRPFVLVKFRTMVETRNANGELLPDGERLGRLGRFLRRTSLDELPELWHVIKGDMSLVGPRPLLLEYLRLYSPEQARRHEIRPGITGWAQVHGRNALDWDRRFALDVWYVDHVSPMVDLRIFVKTAASVMMCEGIAADDHATMPKFTGRGADGR